MVLLCPSAYKVDVAMIIMQGGAFCGASLTYLEVHEIWSCLFCLTRGDRGVSANALLHWVWKSLRLRRSLEVLIQFHRL